MDFDIKNLKKKRKKINKSELHLYIETRNFLRVDHNNTVYQLTIYVKFLSCQKCMQTKMASQLQRKSVSTQNSTKKWSQSS